MGNWAWGPCWSGDHDHLNKSQILKLIEIGPGILGKLFEDAVQQKHAKISQLSPCLKMLYDTP